MARAYNKVDYTTIDLTKLTVDELNIYGVGHINKYTSSSVGTAYDKNVYGGMAYYSSETCGYVDGSFVTSGCTTTYDSSEVKYGFRTQCLISNTLNMFEPLKSIILFKFLNNVYLTSLLPATSTTGLLSEPTITPLVL